VNSNAQSGLGKAVVPVRFPRSARLAHASSPAEDIPVIEAAGRTGSKQVSVEMPAGIGDDSGQPETFSSDLWNGNQMVLSTVETHDASEL
jgi:hypothetical protein